MEAPARQAPGLARIATKYGLIDGVLAFILFLVITLTGMRQNWLSTVISIALLVVLMVLAHREYKQTHEGIMSYAQGLGSGTLLCVVASVLAAVLLFIYVSYINTGYPAAAMKAQQAVLEQRGLSGAQLDQAMAMASAMLTPMGIVITSLVSGVIVGFIVALIVSAFTRESDPRAVI